MIFNFDEWAELAKQDSEAFEAKRRETLQQAIADCAGTEREKRMLNGLQFRVDMLRRKHKSPLGACVAISDMLMLNVRHLIQMDVAEMYEHARQPDLSTHSATILPFTRKTGE